MNKILIFFLLVLFSCSFESENNGSTPVIPRDKMISIMVDLAISDAMVETELLGTNPLIYQKKLGFYDDIFNKYDYSQEDVISSYQIYSEDLKALSVMYDEVIEDLSIQEIELNRQNE